jgi:hypothetical protein
VSHAEYPPFSVIASFSPDTAGHISPKSNQCELPVRAGSQSEAWELLFVVDNARAGDFQPRFYTLSLSTLLFFCYGQ